LPSGNHRVRFPVWVLSLTDKSGVARQRSFGGQLLCAASVSSKGRIWWFTDRPLLKRMIKERPEPWKRES